MKEGWTYKKLGEVANVIHGKNQKDVLSEQGQYPIYGSGGNIMGYANDYLCEAGTTILGRKGSINNPLFIEERFWNVDTAFGISAKEGNDSKFVYYFITSVDWLKKNTGTTLPSLTQQVVKSVELPVPSLSEQQRIVSRLDSAFAHIDERKANAEKQLSEARALFQKALTKAMEPKEGWKEKTIGELTDSCLGKMLDKHKNKGELKPYLRNLNVRWDGFDLDDILEMRFEEGEDDRYGIKEGDLIICEGGEPGRCAIWSNQIANMKIQKALHRVRSKGEIENRFLLFSIMLYSKNGFLDNYESGATIKHLTGEALKRIPISFPPLSEQQRIVVRLDALSENIRKYEEIQRQIISECDALKQALLRKVFE